MAHFEPPTSQVQIPVQSTPVSSFPPLSARLNQPLPVTHFTLPGTGSTSLPVSQPFVEPQALPALPVQSPEPQIPVTVQAQNADCPEILGWRERPNEPQMPRSFSAVAHLKYEQKFLVTVNGKLTVQSRIVTGWQIQWSTVCPVCKAAGRSQSEQRYRPVAGFITARTWMRILEVSEDEQRTIIETVIRRRFDSGRVGQRHPGCVV